MAQRKPITCCPHCGSTEGVFLKITIRQVEYYTGFFGEQQDNSEMYDNAVSSQGRMVYCQECRKPICRLETMEKQWAKGRR